jgi:hypothetical protein
VGQNVFGVKPHGSLNEWQLQKELPPHRAHSQHQVVRHGCLLRT